ncbi:hypothetical protein BHE74_00049519 [Ensete ventricosum]|nr:hypothetical protein BHE74_00049519 [Ensete ventricosum]
MASLGGGESRSAAAVCRMCGDHGLLQELYQCKSIIGHTTNHQIVVSLVLPSIDQVLQRPLSEDRVIPRMQLVSKRWRSKRSTFCCNAMDGRSSSSTGTGAKVHRQASPSQLNKPIKKLRLLLHQSASDITDRLRSEELSPGFGRGRQVAKGKIRRYNKLLEEVSS